MPEEQTTWDTATATPEAPQVDPVQTTEPTPAPEAPQAVAPTLEKPETPQVETVVETARESESQPESITEPEPKPDEYVAEADDPPEIAALPTPAAKRWAKRQFKDAKAIHAFDDYAGDISQVGQMLFDRSKARYTEHVVDLFKRHSQDLLGLPFDEIKARLQANGTPATTPTSPLPAEVQSSEIPLLTEAEASQMTDAQIAQRAREIQQATEAKLRAEYDQKYDDLKNQLDAVNGKLTTGEQQARQAEIASKQDEIYTQVWSVVDEVIRNSGLEANPADPPKIASLKAAGRRLLDKHNVEAAFDASPDNQKIVQYVVEATNRREFQNAEREVDNLKVRARAAAVGVTQGEEMKAIMEEIEAYANQSKTKSRVDNPIPPAPGSALGVQMKPPTTWDEAERPVAA